MQKKLIRLFILFAIIVSSALYTVKNLQLLNKPPYNLEYSLYPLYAVCDSRRNVFVLENTWRRILKINRERNILFSIEGGKKIGGYFYEAYEITTDENDNLYVLNIVYDPKTELVDYEEIQRYNSSGRFEGVIVRIRYSGNDRPKSNYNNIRNITVKNGYLFYLQRQKDNSGALYAVPVSGGDAYRLILLPNLSSIVSFTVKDNVFYFVLKNGKIYTSTRFQELKPHSLYNASDVEIPYLIRSDASGNFFVTDIGKLHIVKITQGKSRIILSKELLANSRLKTQKAFFRHLFVHDNGDIVSVEDYSKRIIMLDAQGNVLLNTNRIHYPKSVVYHRIFSWIMVCLLLCAVVLFKIYFYRDILKRKLSLIFKQIIIFTPVIFIAIIVISFSTYRNLYKRYEAEIYKKLKVAAALGAQDIDGDALKIIKGPENYLSPEYNKISLQKNSLFKSRFNWESTLSASIYKYAHDIFYMTASNYYGVLYPFVSTTDIHLKAFQHGIITSGKYTGFDGVFMAAVSPIRAKNGEITGILEVWLYEPNFDEVNDEFKKNLILGITIAGIAYILVLFFFAFFLIYPLKKVVLAMRKVGEGDLDQRVNIHRNDEIGMVAQNFNEMVIGLNEKERLKTLLEELQEKNRIIAEDMKMAKRIQTNLICKLEDFPELAIGIHFEPLFEVGGDIYDIFKISDKKYRLFIADATGHGVQAAMTTMIIKSEYDNVKFFDMEPNTIIKILNNAFFENYYNLSVFFSCSIADIDLEKNILSFSSAGHPDQLLITKNSVLSLERCGKLIGVNNEEDYEMYSLPFEKGDKLLLFSDGLFEQFNEKEEELGEETLFRVVKKYRNKPIADFISLTVSEVKKWTGEEELSDDITVIGIEYL